MSLVQNNTFITSLYLGLLDRLPDESGLNYWLTELENGTTREEITQSFLASDEFITRAGLADASEVIETVYSNAFDRPADEQGLRYWSDAVNQGALVAQVINQILSVTNDPNNGDGHRLSNAIQSAMHTRDTAVRLGVSNYWQGAEVDGISYDLASVAEQNYFEQIRLGFPVTAAPQIRFDNVIYGDKIESPVIEGTNLNDLIVLGAKTLSVFARDGDDSMQGTDLGTMFWPGNGNDTVEAGGGSDIIDARPDAPVSNRDVFYGQDGDDFIFGGMGNEFIDGGDGRDFISAGGGNDTVRGGIGNDEILKDGGGNFNILGEAGNDTITVRGNAESTGIINGAAGNDTINVDSVYSLSIYAGTGDDTATIKNIEHGGYIFMEDGNDTLNGVGLKSMEIDMGAGHDHITLRNASNVTVILGDGNDTIEIFDSDNVVVQGGRGADTIRIENSTNINAEGGYGEDNQFYVDTKSLNSNSLKLIGGTSRWDWGENSASSLVITDLKNGDKLTFNEDNYSNFYYLKFDYDVRARMIFEKNDNFGVEHYKETIISNIKGNETALRSDIWIMQDTVPFNENWNLLFNPTNPGEWSTLLNDGIDFMWADMAWGRMFFDDVPQVYRPYLLEGNLMNSWVI